jgi:hypothetical protein
MLWRLFKHRDNFTILPQIYTLLQDIKPDEQSPLANGLNGDFHTGNLEATVITATDTEKNETQNDSNTKESF